MRLRFGDLYHFSDIIYFVALFLLFAFPCPYLEIGRGREQIAHHQVADRE